MKRGSILSSALYLLGLILLMLGLLLASRCSEAQLYQFVSSLQPLTVVFEPPASETCFRPGPTSCEALVLREIGSAKRTIDFEAYSLTDSLIVAALKTASSRGVLVRSVVDQTSSLATRLPGDVWTDCVVKIMHNKVVIVDGESVGFGSFNFSYAAEHHNAENHVWIHNVQLATQFVAEFERLVAVSVRGTACR